MDHTAARRGPPIWITVRPLRQAGGTQLHGAGALPSSGHVGRQHLHIVRGLEGGGGDEALQPTLVKRWSFGEAIGGIDGHGAEPGLRSGELRQRPFGSVQRPDPDPRAAFEAEREQAVGRQRIDTLRQLGPGPSDAVAWRHQSLAVGPAPHGLIDVGRWYRPATAHGDAAHIALCNKLRRRLGLHRQRSRNIHDAGPRRGWFDRAGKGYQLRLPSGRSSIGGLSSTSKPANASRQWRSARQHLHQDHASDVARRVDPVIGVGEPGPGEASGAAAFGIGRHEAEAPFLTMSG